MTSDLKRLGQLIEIVTKPRHSVEMSGTSGRVGAVAFGCDGGGAFVVAYDGERLAVDEARTLVADLLSAIEAAEQMEWARERGLRKDGDS